MRPAAGLNMASVVLDSLVEEHIRQAAGLGKAGIVVDSLVDHLERKPANEQLVPVVVGQCRSWRW